jgi:tRNA(Arg) A34 adenosine deaminase TadA
MSILNRTRRIIEHLFILAQDIAPVKSSRLAACIVLKNNIIGYGFSQMKSHPFQAQYAKHEEAIYWHAETNAINNALKRITTEELSKCTLYIARAKRSEDNKHWQYGLSCPCPGCAGAIATFDIQKVVYTLDGNDYKYM